jgi:hypothetical protein
MLSEKRNSIGCMLDKFSVNKSIKKFSFSSSSKVVLNTPENKNKCKTQEFNSDSKIPFKIEEEEEIEVIYHETMNKKSPVEKQLFHDNSYQPLVKSNKLKAINILDKNAFKEQPKMKEFLAMFKHEPSKNKLARLKK